MNYQIFTRRAGTGERPRRRDVVDSIEAARAACANGNASRTRKQVKERYFWEFANVEWFNEAWPK